MTSRLLRVRNLRTASLTHSLTHTSRRAFSEINFPKIRAAKKDEIAKIVEVQQRELFLEELRNLGTVATDDAVAPLHQLSTEQVDAMLEKFDTSSLQKDALRDIIDASLSTFLLHVESRLASSQGLGFYTIGPCGEELLSAIGANIRPNDPLALHYRHVAVSISRQLGAGQETKGKSIEEVILDRARGYVCSTLDPVTGGRHCAIGGSAFDFYVTSTLASQAPPAVGRALAIPLASHLLREDRVFPKDSVSVMSIGEGSTNNAHFLAALNMAEYSVHMKRKCPIVFIVTDNQMCISLKDNGWVKQGATSNVNMKKIRCDGNDIMDVHRGSEEAMNYARKMGRPVLLLVEKLNRRFGHAATDRQIAYLTADEISDRAQFNNVLSAIQLAHAAGIVTKESMIERYEYLWKCTEEAFDEAVNEPKITDRETLKSTNSAAIVPLEKEPGTRYSGLGVKKLDPTLVKSKQEGPLDNMRKHMTRFFNEALSGGDDRASYLPPKTSVVYLGEDVRHGGYYLVTEGLFKKHPAKVHDFPPDETILLGSGQGFAQAGLLPIVEVPYAKYLDCGGDMFYEIVMTYWLSNTKQQHGMLLRLQGFDKGKFGGNFHTHNELHLPVGLDVVCYSNGSDYVRGMRHCLRVANQGRVVMSVDCTDLLNRRHLGVSDDHSTTTGKDKDDHWLTLYPSTDDDNAVLTFEDVIRYPGSWDAEENGQGGQLVTAGNRSTAKGKVLIVSYGNGLPTSLQAMKQLIASKTVRENDISVVDCPYLSRPPQALMDLLNKGKKKALPFEHVIFADVCKESAGMPFAGFVIELQKKKMLPPSWSVIGAQNTYNPLGQTLTFLAIDDIVSGVTTLLESAE